MSQTVFSPTDQMTSEHLRQLVRQKLNPLPDEHDGDFRLNPEFQQWVYSRAVKPAAVLIPVFDRADGLSVLLTRRHEQLKSHSGQVAFPGGKIDAEDASAEAAALREAHEEVGLEHRFAEVIGRLPDYYAGSGYRIAPILALIDPAARLSANPEEVDQIFEVPLAFLMDPANHRQGSREFQGKQRYYLEMPYGDHFIWGVTAGIIRCLHDRVFA
ncbi:MAG: CoA pyrophosphatase [Rhizobiaceae bacterium]